MGYMEASFFFLFFLLLLLSLFRLRPNMRVIRSSSGFISISSMIE